MAFLMQFDVYKNILNEENEVIRTKLVTTIWLECKVRTFEEELAIAKEHNGDMLQFTGKNKFT